jgi:hypothetical protein
VANANLPARRLHNLREAANSGHHYDSGYSDFVFAPMEALAFLATWSLRKPRPSCRQGSCSTESYSVNAAFLSPIKFWIAVGDEPMRNIENYEILVL